MRLTGLFAVGIAAGSVVAGCGDENGRLTRSEFIERADAICAATNALVAPIFESVWADIEDWDGPSGDDAPVVFVRLDQAVDEVMPHFERQLDRLRELELPAARTRS